LNVDLRAGVWSLTVTGAERGEGVCLVNLWEADDTMPRIRNFSARSYVGSGEAALIAGFVVLGDAPKTVLIRAVGPALAAYGVSRPLSDPRITLHAMPTSAVLATSDNWSAEPSASDIRGATATVGAMPLQEGGSDAALLVTLQPGVYSAVTTGAHAETGVALLEVYELE
jgi:hypothetical protein